MNHLDAKMNITGQPLSTKVTALLIEMLKTEWKNEQKLPSELDLSQLLGVSRTVVRDALSQLEREGMIERVRGVGTVINHAIVMLGNRLDLKFEYNTIIKNLGFEPSSDSVFVTLLKADELIASKLDINIDDDVIRCEKRILASGKPAIYSIDYFAYEPFGQRNWKDINWDMPLLDVLEEYCGMFIQTTVSELSPVTGTEKLRRLMQVDEEAALLKITELCFARHNKPVLYAEEYYTDLFKFSILRKKF